MAEYEKSGLIWPNKKGQEKHPDMRGICTIDGKKWEIAAWKRDDGKMGLKFSEPRERPKGDDDGGTTRTRSAAGTGSTGDDW